MAGWGDYLETVDQDQMSTVTKVEVLSSQKYSSQTMVVIRVCSSLPVGTWCQDAWSVFHPELTSLVLLAIFVAYSMRQKAGSEARIHYSLVRKLCFTINVGLEVRAAETILTYLCGQ